MSLTAMVEQARTRVAAQKEVLSSEDVTARAQALIAEELADNAARDIVDREGSAVFTHPFYASISRPGIVAIAEMVHKDADDGQEASAAYLDVAIDCSAAGVAAFSYITEPSVFHGSDEEFFEIADTISAPVLCKDIIVDQYQVDLACAQGAQAITLVARILSEDELKTLSERAFELGMDVVVAVQNEEDVAKALNARASVMSINDVIAAEELLDFEGIKALYEAIPEDVFVLVGGIAALEDVTSLAEMDVKGVFLGEVLLDSDDRRLTMQKFNEVVDKVLSASMANFGPMMPGPGMPGGPDVEQGVPGGPGEVGGPCVPGGPGEAPNGPGTMPGPDMPSGPANAPFED